MRFPALWLAFALPLLVLLAACGKDGKNPVGPGDTAFTVSGKILPASLLEKGKIAGGIPVTLTGPSGKLTVTSDSLGNYSFLELKPGVYSLTAGKEGLVIAPEVRTVTVGKSDIAVESFFCVKSEDAQKNSFICGRVQMKESGALPGIGFLCRNKADSRIGGSVSVDSTGYCRSYPLDKGKTFILTTRTIGFEFVISPDSIEVNTDAPILIRNFTLERKNIVLHTVSGRLLSSKGKPIFAGVVITQGNRYSSAYTDSLGFFSFQAPDGDYTLMLVSLNYQFPTESIPVSVKGEDVIIPDQIGAWIGSTWYTVSGRVIDQYGKGISGVTIIGKIPRIDISDWVPR